jgi:endonuclease G
MMGSQASQVFQHRLRTRGYGKPVNISSLNLHAPRPRPTATPQGAVSTGTAGANPTDTVEIGHTGLEQVPPKLAEVLAQVGKPYYDEVADAKARSEYYQGLDLQGSPQELFHSFHKLMRSTHTETLAFDAPKYLHGWVDLRPNLRLQSIYSTVPVSTDAPVKSTSGNDFKHKIQVKVKGRERADGTFGPDRKVNRKVDFRNQVEAWTQTLAQGPMNALQIAANIALIEGHRFYNAEHSVPQSTFDRDKKPKGDLHHLFTCERNANSHRGAIKYGEVPKLPEHRRPEGWSTRDYSVYEPDAGKGAVARATLYFLMRYPEKLGDKEGEYTKADLPILLKWHQEDPVSLYELHRNAEIQKIQGNRNPLIDFPELAERIDFSLGLAPLGRNQG